MPKQNVSLQAFNRGVISPLALARTDIERLQLSAETSTNWRPRTLGSMMLRPGSKYLGATYGNNASRLIDFVFSQNDTAMIEFTDSAMRVWVDNALITRPTVTAAITNGTFATNVTGWTDADTGSAVSDWVTGTTLGYMRLYGDGTNSAARYQIVSVGAYANIEHSLAIRIGYEFQSGREYFGSVTLNVGSTAGGGEYISNMSLGVGRHSIAFTPTGDFYVQFSNRDNITAYVRSCSIEGAGVMVLTSPYAPDDLSNIRWVPSGNYVYLSCENWRQHEIVRRGTRSWSLQRYYSDNGPFLPINITATTITPSAITGYDVTLTASTAIFSSSHVGSLFKLISTGQTVTASLSAQNTFTNTILVTGTGTHRAFTITRSGTWVATITLQRSLTSDTGPWEDVTTYTTNGTVSYNDALDNQDVWYRIGIKTGGYTSSTPTVDLTLTYAFGGITGVARVTRYTSVTSVICDVISDFGATSATADWYEGEWSDYRGWPTACGFADGRLFWEGLNKIWGSVSDDYYNFDDDTEGDSGPINRSIGFGPVDNIRWMLSLQRMVIGSDGNEIVCKSSSLDEPLTPTAFTMRSISNQGSSNVQPLVLDKNGIYVQRGGLRLMELSLQQNDGEYGSNDLNTLSPEICEPNIVRIAIQRKPDTRIYCVLSDGTMAILVYDRAENVTCWIKDDTDGSYEDVAVLPGQTADTEDFVYFVVNRTINGSTVRYLERQAFERDCQGGSLNHQADAYYEYSGASATTITGLSHLEAKEVVVWGNSKDLGTYTVSSGSITLSEAVTSCIIGLAYTAQWKSSKLAYAAALGTALGQKKKINQLGVILRNTHYQGLQYGRDFTLMDELPQNLDGANTAADTVHSHYDHVGFEFPGSWDTDSRLCLQAQAPKPCNILAAIVSVETHDKY